MSTTTTQINFRLPTDIKELALLKAQTMGTNLSDLVKNFLTQFVYAENAVQVNYQFDRDKILDHSIRNYVNSTEGKEQLDSFSRMLQQKKMIA